MIMILFFRARGVKDKKREKWCKEKIMQKLQEVVLYYQAVKETGAADKTDAENKAKTADKE